ncbi:MAG: hypothetical protein AABW54_00755 [Candidatus Micrarchaeota archaeon]
MKRGFIFTLAIVALAAVLAANVGISPQPRMAAAVQELRATAVSAAWGDVAEDLHFMMGLNATKVAENLSFNDVLPASRNLSKDIAAYGRFVDAYYSIASLNVTVTTPGGLQMPLSQISPPITVSPFGLNYTYPAGGNDGPWGKRELQVTIPEENFSSLASAGVSLRVLDGWVSDAYDGSCAFWSPSHECTFGTQNCLHLTLVISDANTSYTSTCGPFNADQQSKITLNVQNYSSSGWIRVTVGQLDQGNLLTVSFQNTRVAVNSNFTFTTSDFDVDFPVRLAVNDSYFGESRSAAMSFA